MRPVYETMTQLFSFAFMINLIPLVVRGFAETPLKTELWNSGTCPYAQRAWIALIEKGVPFDCRKVDLKNKAPEFEEVYRKANPNPLTSSKVPVLVVTNPQDGKTQVYTESKVVVEAIEELWPEPHLLPADDLEARGTARMFGDIYDAAFGGSRSAYKLAMRKIDSEESKGTWDFDEEKKSLCDSLAALDTCLRSFSEEGPFVLGEQFSLAECLCAPFAQRADAIFAHYGGMNVVDLCRSKGYTRAANWWRAVLERESVVATGVSPEQTIESSKRLIEMMRSRAQS